MLRGGMMRHALAVLGASVVLARASIASGAPPTPSPPDSTAPVAPAGQEAPSADKPPVVIWPTLTPAGDAPTSVALHKPLLTERELSERAQELDATLRDAVQDLGFTLFVADAGPAQGHTRDEDLVERASRSAAGGAPDQGTWVVSPRIEAAGSGQYVVRVVAVPPRGHELRVRVETVPADSVSVRGLVMLRDLLTPQAAADAAAEHAREQSEGGTKAGIVAPLRSQGRAVLAINAGLFGGYTGFSLQRSSGSEDPRVLYPLLALGSAIGVGGALLVAGEWDVTTGDAWYLSAAAGWGGAAAFLLAAGQNQQPLDDRYATSVGGGLIGVTLATFALTRTQMDDGDAALAHSGGALGMLLGGGMELIIQGRDPAAYTPYNGMGYGAAIGLVGAGLLATAVTVSPSRVLLVDVGAGGGALVGAAAGSPLIFQNATPLKTSAWLSVTVGGALLGSATAWWLTRESWQSKRGAWTWGAPTAGVIGASETPRGMVPAYGVGWAGAF
jgi:hypothetical protein